MIRRSHGDEFARIISPSLESRLFLPLIASPSIGPARLSLNAILRYVPARRPARRPARKRLTTAPHSQRPLH